MDEREKYEHMWSIPAYRQSSPGELLVEDFLNCWKASGCAPVVNDYGCGSGKASFALWRHGFDVQSIDFAENCLDEHIRAKLGPKLQFVRSDLAEMDARVRSTGWGFCCDVMEHIPEDRVEKVLANIAERSENAYFNISGRADLCGPQYLGVPLHLTIRESDYWRALLGRYWQNIELRTGKDDDYVFVCRGRKTSGAPNLAVTTREDTSQDPYRMIADTVMGMLRSAPPPRRPPLSLMQDMGCPTEAHYDRVLVEFTGELIWKCKLEPTSNVLDIGSGCGRIASGLAYYLNKGNYLGFDVWEEGIRWSAQNITPFRPNFRFHLLTAENNYYYQDDSGVSNQFDLSFIPRNHFDCIFATSVFTHLRRPDAEQYFRMIREALKPGALAYLTFYVMDEHVRRFVEETGQHRAVQPNGDGMWHAYSHRDFFAGFEEWLLFGLFHENGLEVVERAPGSWAQKPHARFPQDWFLLRRA